MKMAWCETSDIGGCGGSPPENFWKWCDFGALWTSLPCAKPTFFYRLKVARCQRNFAGCQASLPSAKFGIHFRNTGLARHLHSRPVHFKSPGLVWNQVDKSAEPAFGWQLDPRPPPPPIDILTIVLNPGFWTLSLSCGAWFCCCGGKSPCRAPVSSNVKIPRTTEVLRNFRLLPTTTSVSCSVVPIFVHPTHPSCS